MLPPVTIKVNLPERIGMMIVCMNKKYGDHRLMYLLKQAKDVIKPSDEERKEYEITARPGGGMNWDIEKAKIEKEITIPALIFQMIEDELRHLSKAQQIEEDLVDIATKMLGNPIDDGKDKPKTE
jgi:mannose/fructose/N-acetylgalactosamine-specific phosphotransferase system component IIB